MKSRHVLCMEDVSALVFYCRSIKLTEIITLDIAIFVVWFSLSSSIRSSKHYSYTFDCFISIETSFMMQIEDEGDLNWKMGKHREDCFTRHGEETWWRQCARHGTHFNQGNISVHPLRFLCDTYSSSSAYLSSSFLKPYADTPRIQLSTCQFDDFETFVLWVLVRVSSFLFLFCFLLIQWF